MAHRIVSAAREACGLPWLLLTAGLLGSVRLDAAARLEFVPPTLFALILAVMLVGLLVRCGVVHPAALMAASRTPLQNINGLVVMIALLFASAQIFTMLTPEGGLLVILFNGFYVAMLWMTGAARPDRLRLLRSLLVLSGWALVMRFVVLNGLAAPDGSIGRRLFTAALEGLTLGALGLTYHHPATGYIAFGMLGLYFGALLLMPAVIDRRRAAAIAIDVDDPREIDASTHVTRQIDR
jgi:hypothetical protein